MSRAGSPSARSIRARVKRVFDAMQASRSPAHAFEHIYRDKLWGESGDFYSGEGSHESRIVDPYVDAIIEFARTEFTDLPSAVDLGCGDFNVGSRIRHAFSGYVACDVVEPLVERNRQRFSGLSVEFRLCDLTKDPLPSGEVAMIRQVLQHLSNADVSKVTGKLSAFRWVIVTEHLPGGRFVANLDKPRGYDIRAHRDPPSGLDLVQAPFSMKVFEARTLCRVGSGTNGEVIETVAYRMR